MANEFKEFTELLLDNLKSLTIKVDRVQKDMSDVREKVAVLSEKSRAADELQVCVEDLKKQVGELDKTVAVKSGLWGLGGAVVTLLIAIIIAIITGAFDNPRGVNYDYRPKYHPRPDSTYYND